MKPRKLPPYSADEIAADPDLAAALVRESEPLLHIERQMKALREQKADLFDDLRLSRYKPEFAKAWVAAQMPDEEKEALRAEKAIELARVVAAMDVAQANRGRARAGARDTRKPAARQEEDFDQETGEVRAGQPAYSDAETSSSEALCEHGAGAPMHPMDPAPHTIERSGQLHIPEEPPSPSKPRSLTDSPPSAHRLSACGNPAAGQVTSGQSGMTATEPDAHPLIADAAARQEAARKLLGQAEAAE